MKKEVLTVAILTTLVLCGCNNKKTTPSPVQNSTDISQTEFLPETVDNSAYSLKSRIPKNVEEGVPSDIGQIQLGDYTYSLQYLKKGLDESISFHSDDEEVYRVYFDSEWKDESEEAIDVNTTSEENTEEAVTNEETTQERRHAIKSDVLLFKNKYLIIIEGNDNSSLRSFTVHNETFDPLEIADIDISYSYKIDNDRFLFSNNENDYVKGVSSVDKYYRVNYELTESKGIIEIKTISKDYKNIKGPSGQS